ncbi:hypothetical protein HIJ39_12945 [Sulfobacillus sp. DSM 109850]|uniref:Uncharacterized protein n=2 Tax=Sulfobacillus harzensis TaxID=2729629 RepID=A0A7Y0L4V3_9FIRM|nr:hypothetical protein [Sulfobacillus harzensis]NMP23245.1 hypothetical protein [Sulfobacillus harzensis]
MTGPLTVEGPSASVTVVQGRQCTLCGNLQVMIPQALLVRLYPPGVRYLTESRRARLTQRRRMRRRQLGV